MTALGAFQALDRARARRTASMLPITSEGLMASSSIRSRVR